METTMEVEAAPATATVPATATASAATEVTVIPAHSEAHSHSQSQSAGSERLPASLLRRRPHATTTTTNNSNNSNNNSSGISSSTPGNLSANGPTTTTTTTTTTTATASTATFSASSSATAASEATLRIRHKRARLSRCCHENAPLSLRGHGGPSVPQGSSGWKGEFDVEALTQTINFEEGAKATAKGMEMEGIRTLRGMEGMEGMGMRRRDSAVLTQDRLDRSRRWRQLTAATSAEDDDEDDAKEASDCAFSMSALRRPSLLASIGVTGASTPSNAAAPTAATTTTAAATSAAGSTTTTNSNGTTTPTTPTTPTTEPTALTVTFCPTVEVRLVEDVWTPPLRSSELWYSSSERRGFQLRLVQELQIWHHRRRRTHRRPHRSQHQHDNNTDNNIGSNGMSHQKDTDKDKDKDKSAISSSSLSQPQPSSQPQGQDRIQVQVQVQEKVQVQVEQEGEGEEEEVTLRGIEHYASSRSLSRQKEEQHSIVWAVLRCQEQQRRLLLATTCTGTAHPQLPGNYNDNNNGSVKSGSLSTFPTVTAKQLMEAAAASTRMAREVAAVSRNLSQASRERAAELGGQDEIAVFGRRRTRHRQHTTTTTTTTTTGTAMEVDIGMDMDERSSSSSSSSSSTSRSSDTNSQDYAASSPSSSSSSSIASVEENLTEADDFDITKSSHRAAKNNKDQDQDKDKTPRRPRPNRASLTDDQHRHSAHYMPTSVGGPATSPYFADGVRSASFRPAVQLDDPMGGPGADTLPHPPRRPKGG